MASFYSKKPLFSMMFFSIVTAAAFSAPPQALLMRGTESRKGIPGFGANAIECLYGKYRLEGPVPALEAEVFAVSQTLLFREGEWTETTVQKYASRFRTWPDTGGQRNLWCIRRTLNLREGVSDRSAWYFIISLPQSLEESVSLAFIQAFVPRTEFFFTSARSPSDISFPASLFW